MGIKLHGQVSWVLTVIYTNPHSHIRDWLWQELQGFAIDCMKPWLLAGDYNETISLEECNHGGPDMRRRCNRFKQWIENNGLIDLGYSGPKFTWARGLSHDTQKEARLDRALCNETWRVKFLEGQFVISCKLVRITQLLLISTGGFTKPPLSNTLFRFQVA